MSEINKPEGEILQNINQIVGFLKTEGYLVAYNTVAKHIRQGTLLPRRGGGYSERTALSWARQYVQRRIIDEDPDAGTPEPAVDATIAERDAIVKLELKEQALRTAKFEEQRKRGRYIDIAAWPFRRKGRGSCGHHHGLRIVPRSPVHPALDGSCGHFSGSVFRRPVVDGGYAGRMEKLGTAR